MKNLIKPNSLKKSLLATLFVLSSFTSSADKSPNYFNLQVPGADPVKFEPSIFENLNGLVATNPEMSPDFKHFFFTLVDPSIPDKPKMTIMYSHQDKNGWSNPIEASFLKEKHFNMAEPFFSHDGQTLYFQSNRPPGEPVWNVKAFSSEIIDGKFTKPKHINIADENQGVWFPNPAKDGSIYFSSNLKDRIGRTDLYVAHKKPDGEYAKPVNLGTTFNTDETEWDPYLNKDENILLWVSDKPGGYGEVDVYMSRLQSDDQWGKAINLGAPINTPLYDTAAKLSPDGKFLFFQRIINDKEVIFWVDFEKYLTKHKL